MTVFALACASNHEDGKSSDAAVDADAQTGAHHHDAGGGNDGGAPMGDAGHQGVADAGDDAAAQSDAGLVDSGAPTLCGHLDSSDTNGDGTIDRTVKALVDGLIEDREFDDDGDGTIDRTMHLEHTAGGELLSRETVEVATGTVISVVRGKVNAAGLIVRSEVDSDADGNIDQLTKQAYNADGSYKSQEWSTDSDDDGTFDSRRLRTFDAAGVLLLDEFDDDNDGVVDRYSQYSYDTVAAGQRMLTQDFEGGVLQRGERVTTDDGDHMVKLERDNDGDGTFNSAQDEVIDLYYDADGNELRETYDGLPVDGAWDVENVWTYLAPQKPLTQINRKADMTVLYQDTWTYDADGNELVRSSDADGDGVEDWRSESVYNAKGFRTSYTEWTNGTRTRKVVTKFDSSGREIRIANDDNGDGTVDSIVQYEYDSYGRVTVYRSDINGDGSDESFTETTYFCPPEM